MAPIEPMSMSVSLTRSSAGSDCTVVCVAGEHDLSTVSQVDDLIDAHAKRTSATDRHRR